MERLIDDIQKLKISEPVKIDLLARVKRAENETDVIDRQLLLTDLRHEVKRLTSNVISFTDLYEKAPLKAKAPVRR